MTTQIRETDKNKTLVATFEDAAIAILSMPAIARAYGKAIRCECNLPTHVIIPRGVAREQTSPGTQLGSYLSRP